jgi:hypothetical protein
MDSRLSSVKQSVLDAVQLWFVFAVLTAFYILLNRYDFLVGPQGHFLAKIKSIQNPGLDQNDFFIHLSNRLHGTLPAWPLAYLSTCFDFDIPWLFLGGHFISTLFYLAGVFYISMTLFKDKPLAFFTVLAFFFIKPVLVDASLYPTYFYHRNIAWALQLFSIYFLFTRRLGWAGLLLGLSFDCSAYTGAHLLMLFGFALVCLFREYCWRDLLKGAVAFLTVASPILIWSLSAEEGASLRPAGEQWLSQLRVVAPGYLFPSMFLQPESGKITTVLMAFVWPFYYLASFLRGYVRWTGIHRLVGWMMVGVLVLFALGTLFSEVWPISAALKLMLFRSHKYFVLFAILYFMHYLASRYREESGAISRVFVVVVVVAFLSSKMILCTTLALVDAALQGVYARGGLRRNCLIIVMGLMLVLALIPFSYQPPVLNRLFHLDIPFFAVCLLTAIGVIWHSRRPSENSSRIPVLWLAYVCAFTVILLPTYWGKGDSFRTNPVKMFADQIAWPWKQQLSEGDRSLFRWIRENTEKRAVFLTPMHDGLMTSHFFWETQRATVLSSGAELSILSPTYAKEWFERMEFFKGLPITNLLERYRTITEGELLTFGLRYPFDYLIYHRGGRRLDFPVAHENEKYVIYRIPREAE